MSDNQTTEVKEKKKGKGKAVLLLISMLVIASGIGFGFHFYWQGANYLVTDNARVTTNLISIVPPISGKLEKIAMHEGRYVSQNQVIGWVGDSASLRSPIDGLIVKSYAVQNQIVSPHSPVAVIADIDNLHIQANIEETDIKRVQLGQRVTVTIDAFGNRQFSGYVSEIGWVTQAELAGNATFFTTGGTFTRVTQLIPVKINILDDINLNSVIGVSARVRIAL